ncbi:MAG: PP2C family serine/threonine-protein phosphatase [Chitinophagaceae bacterium]
MSERTIQKRADEIIKQPLRMLNATVGKPFETKFDFKSLGWEDIAEYQFEGLETTGLAYDAKTGQLTGTPIRSGDIRFAFRFRLNDEPDDAPFSEKWLTIIINPDPKSLWKNLPSDEADPYWKKDDVTLLAPIGTKHLVVSCKRGRAHANVGSFREDDFSYADLPNGWSLVVVSDGAGSAKFSRKGSVIACNGIVDYFLQLESVARMEEFDALLDQYNSHKDEELHRKLNLLVYNNLGKAVFEVHKKLETFAREVGMTLKDLSSTLVFTLFKKHESGFALLSFGVGDCPMAALNKDLSAVTNLNWIDVGEFGGGTRFITMPEIFSSDKFASRFGFRIVDDLAYLVLMSDGIYDPKFVVEDNLPDIKKWKAFFADLQGDNEDKASVRLSADNPEIVTELSRWMDFWSIGNHDDRTLAIVF